MVTPPDWTAKEPGSQGARKPRRVSVLHDLIARHTTMTVMGVNLTDASFPRFATCRRLSPSTPTTSSVPRGEAPRFRGAEFNVQILLGHVC